MKPAVVVLTPTATLIVRKKMNRWARNGGFCPKWQEAGSLAEQGLKRKGKAVSSITDAKLIQIQFEIFAAFKKASLVWFEHPGAADSQGQLGCCYDQESDFSQEPGKHLDWDFPRGCSRWSLEVLQNYLPNISIYVFLCC